MIKPKNRKHLDFEIWEKEVLKDPGFKAEYDKLQPEFAVISAIIKARSKNNLTQKQLAEKLGTKQSAIARLESGRTNPSVAFLKRLAEALDSNLQIKFTPA